MKRRFIDIPSPTEGLLYNVPSTMIGDKTSPKCNDVVLRENYIASAPGNKIFAGTDTTPLSGSVMHLSDFTKLSTNTVKLICNTTTNTYVYNDTSKLFECITKGVVVNNCETAWTGVNCTPETSTDKRKGSYSNKLPITNAALGANVVLAYQDFASADLTTYLKLHFYIKSSIAWAAGGLKILLDDTSACVTPLKAIDIPALVANVWKEIEVSIVDASSLTAVISVGIRMVTPPSVIFDLYIDDILATIPETGTEDNIVSSVCMGSTSLYIYSNNVDTIKKWDQATDTVVDLAGMTTFRAKKVLKVAERLVMFNVSVSGTRYAQRVEWTVAGNPESLPLVAGDGSGFENLLSELKGGEIITAEELGGIVYIYGSKSIVQMIYTRDVTKPFAFKVLVPNIGICAQRGIYCFGDSQIIMGFDDILYYQGQNTADSLLVGLTEEVYKKINAVTVNRSFFVKVPGNNELMFCFPVGVDSVPTTYYRANLTYKNWTSGQRTYSGFGYHKAVTTNTIDDMTAAIDTYLTPFDGIDNSSVPELLLMGDTSGGVYIEGTGFNNKGVAIDSYFDTKDFVVGNKEQGLNRYKDETTCWMTLSFEARGTNVEVFYSVDGGDTYLPLTASNLIVLTSNWKTYELDFETTSSQIRFRFRRNVVNEHYDVRWVNIGYMQLTERGRE